MTLDNIISLGPDFVNKDIWKTDTGTFLIDGLVAYTIGGVCIKAFKYKDAGRGEFAEVLGIRWNNQILKGKDSWSANALITPVLIRGSKCTKPSVGSIRKMVDTGLSKGAKVTIILANSTIPQVSKVIKKGDLNFEFPICSCGYKMSEKDIFGALLKCGNPFCSERLERMKSYLNTCSSFFDIDLNKLLIIDRFKWEKKVQNLNDLVNQIKYIIENNLGVDKLYDLLEKELSTSLQKQNLNLVINPAYNALIWFNNEYKRVIR